ncbi:MAG: spore germination protein [Clostridia bacterium]|nr:spore germination protein [Clostridia bacterium]
MEQRVIAGDFKEKVALVRKTLRIDDSFDILERQIVIGGRKAHLFFVDAFTKDEVMEKIFEFIMRISPEQLEGVSEPREFASIVLPYVEIDRESDLNTVVTAILSGTSAMIVEGFSEVFMIDARTYPVRSIDEPQDDKVLRGSHDGFVETMVFNAAMIRRRVRDPRLAMEPFKVGEKSQTDVVLCYMQGICNNKHLEKIRNRIKAITIPSLVMGQESLIECLCRRQRYNPFPKVRYTERPDCAAAGVLEGKILVLVDNSPVVMILPTGIFDFMQDTNDYYFPPLIGSYLRLLRSAVLVLSLFLTPFWFLLMQNEWSAPPWLEFLKVKEPNSVPIILQLLAIELIIDVVKLASLNTPSTLNNAFSIVGALILGDFAVKTNLFVPEVLLYMAFVAVASFTQASYEMGYTFKLMRMLFLGLTALFNVWGFIGGVSVLLLLLATTETPLGKMYLYPLIPFDADALKRLIFRRSISRYNT